MTRMRQLAVHRKTRLETAVITTLDIFAEAA